MPIIFLVLAAIDALLIGATVWLGLAWETSGIRYLQIHMLAGLVASVFTLLTHSTAIFHLVGLGRSIKDAQLLVKTERDFYAENRRLQGRSHPIPVLVCMLAVVTPILGGAVNFGLARSTVHFFLGIALLAAHLVAVPLELRNLLAGDAVARDLESLLEAAIADGEAPTRSAKPEA
jgi:hypothetical protein